MKRPAMHNIKSDEVARSLALSLARTRYKERRRRSPHTHTVVESRLFALIKLIKMDATGFNFGSTLLIRPKFVHRCEINYSGKSDKIERLR